MTIDRAASIARALIAGEQEAALAGNAYLDDFQIEALQALIAPFYVRTFEDDGKAYVFDGRNDGALRCAGPFDTLAAATDKANTLNTKEAY